MLFVAIAVLAAIAGFLRTFCFSVSAEALTARLRNISFKAIMRQVRLVTNYSGLCSTVKKKIVIDVLFVKVHN